VAVGRRSPSRTVPARVGATRRERNFVRLLFLGLGFVPVFLAGWYSWLQLFEGGVLHHGDRRVALSAGTADRQRDRSGSQPGPRGTILDRHGATLAIDCEAYEVRAEVRPPRKLRTDMRELRGYLAELADELGAALATDPALADRGASRRELVRRMALRLSDEFRLAKLPKVGGLSEEQRKILPRQVEFLVARDVAVLSVLEALRKVDQRQSLHLYLRPTHVRYYPARDYTYGLVGWLEDRALRDDQGRLLGYQAFAPAGLEAMRLLEPGKPGRRDFRVDSLGRPYFVGVGQPAASGSVAESTLDLELQKVASRLLAERASVVGENKKGSRPQWGALVLVEVGSGDVLAAASWHRDSKTPKGAAFAPNQQTFEPGSIVKPLVLAYARQFGGLDWNAEFDCHSSGRQHSLRVAEAYGRTIRDDHGCGVLTPHGILVNSSNIGAVKVGALLSREQWWDYLDLFGWRRPVGLPLLNERHGRPNAKGLDPDVTEANFRKWSAASYSFGYEMQVTAFQVARAYLSLLHGRPHGLRLVRRVQVDGQTAEVPVERQAGERVFDPEVVEAIRAAMGDVIDDRDDPERPWYRQTGRNLVRSIREEENVELHGLLAGKTGTAVSRSVVGGRSVEVRNASFVGFLPVDEPRYLAVCVMQKDDSARFYGGSYAAPPATRLLLEALRLEQRRRLRREPQVSVVPGVSGRSGQASETSQVGR
jgi:cell division protein FtsI/penicillin-binding protein 2